MHFVRHDVVSAGRVGEGVDVTHRVRSRNESVGQQFVELVQRLFGQHENRVLDTGSAEFNAFLNESDAQPIGSGRESCLGGRDRTMAVTVGFDDGEEFRIADRSLQDAGVVTDRRGAHLDPRCASGVHARGPRSSSSTAGTRSGRSPAMKP